MRRNSSARIDREVHHHRRLVTMLPQHHAQVLRLRHRSWKAVEHETVPTVRLLDTVRHHFQHQRIRHEVATRHDRLGLFSQWRAQRDILAEHVSGGEMRHTDISSPTPWPACPSPRPEARERSRRDPTVPRPWRPGPLRSPSLPPATQPALPRKSFVIPHDELCFELLHGIHRHAYNDQEATFRRR